MKWGTLRKQTETGIDRIFLISPPLLDRTARWLSNVGGCCKSCRWGTLRLIGGRMEMRECEKWEEGEAWREECWTGFSDRQSNWTEPKARSEKCRSFPCPKMDPIPSSARRMEIVVGGAPVAGTQEMLVWSGRSPPPRSDAPVHCTTFPLLGQPPVEWELSSRGLCLCYHATCTGFLCPSPGGKSVGQWQSEQWQRGGSFYPVGAAPLTGWCPGLVFP